MAIVYDDYRAVNAAQVACAWKVSDKASEIYWIVLTTTGTTGQVTYRFTEEGLRDDFYKRLVEAMGQ